MFTIKLTEKGLYQLNSQIIQEQENLRNEMDKWDELIARSAPLKERIEQARLTEYISKAIQLLPKT